MNDIIILLPKVFRQPKPRDPEEPTQAEIDAQQLYEDRLNNFTPVRNWLERNVEYTGSYRELISAEKAPTWIKNSIEFMLIILKGSRFKRSKNDKKNATLGGLTSLHSLGRDVKFAGIGVGTARQWLSDNEYSEPAVEE